MKASNNISGFTLIEILVYIAISSILILSLVAHIVLVTKLESRSEINNAVSTEIAHLEATLRHTLRSATSVESPLPGSSANSLRVTMKDVTLGESEFLHTADMITLDNAEQPVSPLLSDKVKMTAVNFSNVSRPDTPGTIEYSLTYEWDDEAGEVQSGNSKGTISLR